MNPRNLGLHDKLTTATFSSKRPNSNRSPIKRHCLNNHRYINRMLGDIIERDMLQTYGTPSLKCKCRRLDILGWVYDNLLDAVAFHDRVCSKAYCEMNEHALCNS